MDAAANKTIYLKDYQPTPYAVHTLELRFEIFDGSTRVFCKLEIEKRAATVEGSPLQLDGEDLNFVAAHVDGVALQKGEYDANAKGLTVLSPPTSRFVLETEVEISPETNTQLMGLYRSNGVWCTQCEAEGFRRISYMYDRPDVLATYRVRLEADKSAAPILLANGNLIEAGELSGNRHFAIWEDPFPKPSYLFAVVAGDLGVIKDSFVTSSGRDVALAIYAEHGKQGRCAYAMDALKRAMAWDEKRFGREYDLDIFNIVAVSDFNFGAMENKGLNIFNDKAILADPSTATDADFARIETIVAHEYFHNWTGNRITCRDWFQLCLKEGLTVFRDQEFSSDERSRASKRIADVRDLRAGQFPEDAGPLGHPPRPDSFTEINNFYTATVYNKGAEIVRMLATILGETDFRKGTDLYFERHDGQATTIESWLKVFEDATGRDLKQFAKWYTQAGTPHVTANGRWEADSQRYYLTLSQKTSATPGQSRKDHLLIPLQIGLIGPNGQDLAWTDVKGGVVDNGVILFDAESVELVFEGIASQPVLSLLRGFSAPVNLQTNLTAAELLFKARHDADPFNRWQSLQDVAVDLMVDAVKSEGNLSSNSVGRLADALADTLSDEQLDLEFKSLALALPGESVVSRALGKNVDPALVHDIRRSLLNAIGLSLSAQLRDTYSACADKMSDDQSMDAVNARALKNQCLPLLVASGDPEMAQLAQDQYNGADNMTDKMAALGASIFGATKFATAMLNDFGQFSEGDWLVRDKWLALTALGPHAQTLDQVKALLAQDDFPRTNPNRLRALVGSFAMANIAQFTRADGAGFDFVAEFCAQIDKQSPQVSARMLTAFRSFRSWEPNRRHLAETALQKLAKSSGLSSDLRDILGRTLALEK